jgi:hypothetical protein
MIIKHPALISCIAILILIAPVIILGQKRSILKSFDFCSLLRLLNTALIYQFITGIILIIPVLLIESPIMMRFANKSQFTDFVYGSAISYLGFGIVFYSPAILLLNIINWLIMKFKRVN